MNKILQSAKCCAKIAAQNILSWAQNYRMIMLLLLLIVSGAQYSTELDNFAKGIGEKINGLGILPIFYTGSITGCLIIQIGIVLMFSNAPFKNKDSLFCVLRTGYARWCVGELMYIVSASFIYTVSLFLITNILCANNLFYSLSWGKTFTSAGTGRTKLSVSKALLQQYQPLEALLHTMLLIFLLSVFLGLLIFLMSSLVGRSSGVVLAAAFVMLGLMPESILTQRPSLVAKLSPCSFTELDVVDKLGISSFPSLSYAYTAFIILIVALLSANVIIYSNKKIRHNIYASEV